MELDNIDVNYELKSDLSDLWSAKEYLGKSVEEYDIEQDAAVVRFNRTEEWREALSAIRKLLKKYHSDELCPIRRKMAEWYVFRQKLLPMIRYYNEESDTIYNLGKVLVFLTNIGPSPESLDRKIDPQRRQARSAVVRTVQDILDELVRAPDVLAALLTLVAPALAPGRREGERLEAEVNRVDLFLTLIKQLLECPAVEVSSMTLHLSGLRERFILALHNCAILDMLVELCRLMERREFSRLSTVLMDVWYQLLKTETAETLSSAASQLAKVAKEEQEAAGAARAAAVKASAEVARQTALSKPFQSPYKKPVQAIVPVVVPQQKHNKLVTDLLKASLAAERAAKAPMRQAVMLERHSRFGTVFEAAGDNGTKRISTSAIASATTTVDVAQRAAKRTGGGRKKQDEMYTEPPVTDLAEVRGTMSNTGLENFHHGVSLGTVLQVRSMLHAAASGFLEVKALVLKVAKQQDSDKAKDGADKKEDGEADEDKADDVVDVDGEEKPQPQADDEEEEEVRVSAFATLATAVKDRIVRDSDEVTPSDRLKYLHTTGLLLALHRISAVSAIKTAEDEARRLAKKEQEEGRAPKGPSAAQAARAAIPKYDATPVLPCLDTFSFRNVVAACDDFQTRKVWSALGVAGSHLGQLVLTTHAMVEHGDEDTQDIGIQVYDSMFRDREVSEAIPRVFRAYEPGRFHADFLPVMMEATHYLLKLAERASNEGLRTKGGRRSNAGGSGRKGKEEDEDDDNLDEGEARRRQALRDNAEAERRQREHAAKKEKAFESSRYTSEYVHPSILQAVYGLVSRYHHNTAKVNYFAVAFLRRVAKLPNEHAGVHPKTGAALNYAVATYHFKLLDVADRVLNDSTAKKGKNTADVYCWAKDFVTAFGVELASNPLLGIEALFWRAGKGENGEVATHYGVLDGSAAQGLAMTGDMDAGDLPEFALGKGKKKTKAALAADEAEAETRKLAREREQREAKARARAAGGDAGADGANAAAANDDEEAVVDFDAELDRDEARKLRTKKGKGAKAKGKLKERRVVDSDSESGSEDSASDDSSDSSSSGSDGSDSDGSDGDSSGGKGAGAAAKGAGQRSQTKAKPTASGGARAVVDSDDDMDGAGAGLSQGMTQSQGLSQTQGRSEALDYDPDLALTEIAALGMARSQAKATTGAGSGAGSGAGAGSSSGVGMGPGPASKKLRKTVIDDSDSEDDGPAVKAGPALPALSMAPTQALGASNGHGQADMDEDDGPARQAKAADPTAAVAAAVSAAAKAVLGAGLPARVEEDSDSEDEGAGSGAGATGAGSDGTKAALQWLAKTLKGMAAVLKTGSTTKAALRPGSATHKAWLGTDEVRALLASAGLKPGPLGSFVPTKPDVAALTAAAAAIAAVGGAA